MSSTFLIVFREVLEAGLIVGIVLAAGRGLPSRHFWVWGGVAAGAGGAVLVAGFAGQLADAASGLGQEFFNAGVLFLAVAMLGWHNIWMSKHGRELAQKADQLGRDARAGRRPPYALGVVTGLAVLREGSEVVLFLYGISAAGGAQAGAMLGGGVLGLLGGAALGVGLYFGLVQMPTRYLFAFTSWLILLLAAGLAAQGAFFLVQAGTLPPLVNEMWNTSGLLSQQSALGQVMHVLVGYIARPMGIQVIFYLATVLVIGGLMLLVGRAERTPPGGLEVPPAPAAQ